MMSKSSLKKEKKNETIYSTLTKAFDQIMLSSKII